METQSTAANTKRIRVSLRQIVPGRNPRTFFDEAALDRLAANIDAVDIIQDPVVTFDEARNVYPLAAGERRVRAARRSKRYGEDGEIWVVVRQDDNLTDAVSLSENTEREPMTPLEEAEAAANMLAQCGNDRTEAASMLGWSTEALNKRLGLMNAAAEVREALRTRKIKLGHAELLATMRKEAQVSTLNLLLQREPQLSVGDLKQLLEKAALVLDTAIFDKKDCTGCQHNSSNQTVLFAEAIAGGKCTNKACFEDKTEAELNARAEALKEEFQVVRIVRAGENFTIVPLVAEGPKGVGEEQAQACKTCKSYGAVVSAVPDKLGNVYKNMCMDTVCNVKKVAAAHAPAPTPAPSAPKDGAAKAAAPTAGKVASSDKQSAPEEKPASSEPTQRVKEYREKLWRRIFTEVVMGLDVPKNRAVLIALCATRPSVIDSGAISEGLPAGVDPDRLKPGKMVRKLIELDNAELGKQTQRLAANVSSGMHGLELKDVTDILKVFDAKVATYWKIGKPFFELLTKNEIDAVADEIGLKKHMGADYAKARNGSKAEFIDALLGAKFEFEGRIPKVMDLSSAPR